MSAAPPRSVLVLGYGNPGRADDGLGPALAAEVAARAVPGVRTESGYQLEVEDAALLAEHDAVVFADAARDVRPPFEFRRVVAGGSPEFTTHELAPEALLGITRDVFGAVRPAWVLAIRGEDFDRFSEGLSPGAAANLAAAADFLERALRDGLPAADDTEG